MFIPFLLSTSGCSWLFVTEAPPNHADLPYFDCTSSKLAPIVDTGFGALYGAEAVLIAAVNLPGYESDMRIPMVAISAVIAAVEIGSAIYGYRCTSECKKAKAQLADRMRGAPPGQYLPAQPQYEVPAPCSSDVQCKGDRICESGRCVSPPAPPPPQPAQLPAAQPPPAPAPAAPAATPD